MKVNKIAFVVVGCLLASVAIAQNKDARREKKQQRADRINKLIKEEEQGAIIYQKQTIFGIKLNTDGYAAFLEMGRMKTTRKSALYSLEIGEHKDPKEEKTPSAFYYSNPYVYGKINNFYYAKFGYSQQRIIGNKGNRNGVAVSAIYGGGVSAGLLKPYYLKVTDPQTNQAKDIKYNQTNEDQFLDNPLSVIGATGFTKGFGEMKFTPGLFAKTAMRFDFGRFNELVSAIEVGVNAEYYTKKMPILLVVPAKRFFLNAYAAIAFGKRK